MSSFTAGPSTVDGIKRLAKTIKRERNIPHHLALDLAARKAGYQNIRHAQDQLARQTSALYTAYLTAYWALRGDAGRETLKIQLPKPMGDVVAHHQVNQAKNLRFFYLESTDHLERRIDVRSQEQAHQELFAAARTIQFMAVTGLRPTTTLKQEHPMRVFQNLPGSDHVSRWFHSETGAWIYMDEPYPKPGLDQRAVWASDHRVQMITPRWEGLHNPGSTIPYIFCDEPTFAARFMTQLTQLQTGLSEPVWDGESTSYFLQFVSPAREAADKPRRPRPMPASRGVERGGALPYGSRRGGEKSLWRPAKRMPLELHLALGPLLCALDNSRFPGSQRNVVMRIRSSLDDWLHMEYPGDEMTDEQFHEAYYGTHREPIVGHDKQVEAVRRIAALLQQGYADCRPRQQMLNQLSNVEAALVKNLCNYINPASLPHSTSPHYARQLPVDAPTIGNTQPPDTTRASCKENHR